MTNHISNSKHFPNGFELELLALKSVEWNVPRLKREKKLYVVRKLCAFNLESNGFKR